MDFCFVVKLQKKAEKESLKVYQISSTFTTIFHVLDDVITEKTKMKIN